MSEQRSAVFDGTRPSRLAGSSWQELENRPSNTTPKSQDGDEISTEADVSIKAHVGCGASRSTSCDSCWYNLPGPVARLATGRVARNSEARLAIPRIAVSQKGVAA